MSISITNRTRQPLPRADFASIADHVLGKTYELSLVFCGDALSRRLNRAYRSRDLPTNVLSFPVSKTSGEIFINLSKLGAFSALELFIHGLFHLKGMEHGDTMEKAEQALLHVSSRRRWH
ncbi:rRNA maturation RNAse YbeY [Candidatus Parcubacteria bacterium]|nr:rRNA maturation RNAse YbeY [Candidatus Parcubacteria bacterium]